MKPINFHQSFTTKMYELFPHHQIKSLIDLENDEFIVLMILPDPLANEGYLQISDNVIRVTSDGEIIWTLEHGPRTSWEKGRPFTYLEIKETKFYAYNVVGLLDCFDPNTGKNLGSEFIK